MSFQLLCLRHGRTAWNALGRFQGQSDIPLDEVGREQARQTALHLRDVHIHHVVTSDLQRARETAEIVVAPRQIAIHTDSGLRERNFGSWEGLTWDQIVARHPHLADHTILNARVFEPPEGELFEQTIARAMGAFERICLRVGAGETALLVAHAGLLHALLDGLFGSEREDWMITPASVMTLEIDGTSARLCERDRFTPNHT